MIMISTKFITIINLKKKRGLRPAKNTVWPNTTVKVGTLTCGLILQHRSLFLCVVGLSTKLRVQATVLGLVQAKTLLLTLKDGWAGTVLKLQLLVQ